MLDRRFRRIWDRDHLPAIDAFDAANDLHLDELACHLLERVRRHGDAEAFALLFDVAGRRLEQIARRLVARLQAASAPQDVVENLKRRLWLGEGTPQLGSFLALCRAMMERRVAGRDLRPEPVSEAAHGRPAPRT